VDQLGQFVELSATERQLLAENAAADVESAALERNGIAVAALVLEPGIHRFEVILSLDACPQLDERLGRDLCVGHSTGAVERVDLLLELGSTLRVLTAEHTLVWRLVGLLSRQPYRERQAQAGDHQEASQKSRAEWHGKAPDE